MKKLLFILTLITSSLVLAGSSNGSSAAKDWLTIVDSGNYTKSWQEADAFFQTTLSESKWDGALKGIRAPLGKVISRTEISSKQLSSLPGVPDGEYLIIQYKTTFENKESAQETLTLSKSSGQWLAVGYFIN